MFKGEKSLSKEIPQQKRNKSTVLQCHQLKASQLQRTKKVHWLRQLQKDQNVSVMSEWSFNLAKEQFSNSSRLGVMRKASQEGRLEKYIRCFADPTTHLGATSPAFFHIPYRLLKPLQTQSVFGSVSSLPHPKSKSLQRMSRVQSKNQKKMLQI